MTMSLLGGGPAGGEGDGVGLAIISGKGRSKSPPHTTHTHTHTHNELLQNSRLLGLNQLLCHPLLIINNCFLIRARVSH